MALAALTPAPAGAVGRTYVTDDCFHVRVRPRSIMFACADGGYYVDHLRWSRWRVQRAAGNGLFHQNDCVPNCAGGSFHHREGTITLMGRLRCPDIDRFVFARAVVVYDRPLLGRKTTRFRLFCPLG
jgi:hypothetical protein